MSIFIMKLIFNSFTSKLLKNTSIILLLFTIQLIRYIL